MSLAKAALLYHQLRLCTSQPSSLLADVLIVDRQDTVLSMRDHFNKWCPQILILKL